MHGPFNPSVTPFGGQCRRHCLQVLAETKHKGFEFRNVGRLGFRQPGSEALTLSFFDEGLKPEYQVDGGLEKRRLVAEFLQKPPHGFGFFNPGIKGQPDSFMNGRRGEKRLGNLEIDRGTSLKFRRQSHFPTADDMPE